MPEVDRPAAAALSLTPASPSDFPEASGARDDVTSPGPPRQMKLKFAVLLIAHQFADSRRERTGFDDHHRSRTYANGVYESMDPAAFLASSYPCRRLASPRRFVPRGGFFSAQEMARSSERLVCSRCNHRSLSGTESRSFTSQKPRSTFSTRTWRPAYLLSRVTCPSGPIVFTLGMGLLRSFLIVARCTTQGADRNRAGTSPAPTAPNGGAFFDGWGTNGYHRRDP